MTGVNHTLKDIRPKAEEKARRKAEGLQQDRPPAAEGPFEIERKFLIRRPELAWLQKEADCSEIRQTYLQSPEGLRARVRMRQWPNRCVYTYTEKVKLSALRRIEREREIDAEEHRTEGSDETERVSGETDQRFSV